MLLNFPHKKKTTVLALGAESAGNFSVFRDGRIFSSDDFGDLLEEANWIRYQKTVLQYLKKHKIKPEIILTDLHPLYKTTIWGEKLAKKFGAKLIRVQHHHTHIFSAVGDKILHNTSYLLPSTFYGIAMDGTGYGTDEKIWGGEAFAISNFQFPISNKNTKSKLQIKRIGHLENQIMIGGDLAVREPARMLIGILYKTFCHPERSLYSDEVEACLTARQGSTTKYHQQYHKADSSTTLRSAQNDTEKKNYIYPFIKKYYTKNQFELIYNQLQQNFNCLETSSTGRVLDAISLLLGFCGNKRNYKHEPIDLLEKNSTTPYSDLKPKIIISEDKYILDTTHLFNYVIKYLHKKDKHRLAATAQLYIAEGLWKIIQSARHPEPPIGGKGSAYRNLSLNNYSKTSSNAKQILHSASLVQNDDVFISGGIANNKIISDYLISRGAHASTNIPRGDAGISFGQVVYYLSNN